MVRDGRPDPRDRAAVLPRLAGRSTPRGRAAHYVGPGRIRFHGRRRRSRDVSRSLTRPDCAQISTCRSASALEGARVALRRARLQGRTSRARTRIDLVGRSGLDSGLDTLASLLDKSLVRSRRCERGRAFWMLETIREVARVARALGADRSEGLAGTSTRQAL
jgi:hypothetical protein